MDLAARAHASSRRLLWALALASGALLARPAHAFERQWRVGAGVGIASASGASFGPAVGAHAAYGVSDVFDLHLELTGSSHWPSAGAPRDFAVGALGVAYKLDVLEWIPYALVGAGGAVEQRAGELEARVAPALSAGGGLDYLAWRELAFGVQLRGHWLLVETESSPYAVGLLRAEYRWGW